MAGYTCPSCGQSAQRPPWLIAREAGYHPDRHCAMIANRFGRLVPCVRERLDPQICDVCPISRKYTVMKNGVARWAGGEA